MPFRICPVACLAFLFLSGCSALAPQPIPPYHRPAGPLSLEQRQEALNRAAVHSSPGDFRVGLDQKAHSRKAISKYMADSGRPALAQQHGKSSSGAALLAGIGAYAGLYFGAPVYAGLGPVLMMAVVQGSTAYDNAHALRPAEAAFNRDLAQSLGLPQGTRPHDPLRLQPGSVDPTGHYFLFAMGTGLGNNADYQDHFKDIAIEPIPAWSLDDHFSWMGGRVWGSGLGLEGGGRVDGRAKAVDITFLEYSGDQAKARASFTVYTVELAPGYAFKAGSMGGWAGVGIGGAWAFFNKGRSTWGGGSYTVRPHLRLMTLLGPRSGLGWELGYRYMKIDSVSSGGLLSQAVTLKQAFDLSQPYLSLSVLFGQLPFTR